MAEFNANIVVQPYNIDVTLTQPGITVNPDVTSLNIYAVGGTNGQPAGNVGDLQYYAANGFGAVPSSVANYSNGNLNLSLTGTKIPGGTNGYVLQTDGTGNLNWTAMTGGGGGNGSPGGSNTQIQYNNNGTFAGSTGFTFNNASNLVSMPGSLNIVGNISGNNANFTGNITAATVTANLNGSATTAGTVTTGAQPNITSVGTLTGLTSSGTIQTAGLRLNSSKIALGQNSGNVAQGTNGIAIGFEAGSTTQGNYGIAIGAAAGYDVQGSNAIAIGYYAGYPGNAVGQGANSIAIGSLAGYPLQAGNSIVLNATGANLSANTTNSFYVKPIRNANTGNVLFYNQTTGEISYDVRPASDSISNGTSNVSIPSANGNILFSVNGTANVVTITNNQLIVNGNANVGNLNATLVNATSLTGTLTTAAQPNITSIGALTSLTLNSSNIELGTGAQADGEYSIAIGMNSETPNTIAQDNSVTIGYASYAANSSVTIGPYAGKFLSNKATAATNSVTIGQGAGYGNTRGTESVAIGAGAGVSQGAYSVAIGTIAGSNAGANSIAIGYRSSYTAGYANTITLNATGANFSPTVANAFFVKPIRNATQSNYLYYDATSGEITYDAGTGGGNTAAGANTQVQFNTANLLDASPNFTFDTSTNDLTVGGNIISSSGNLTATNITANTGIFTGNGSGLTSLNASNLSSGTVPSARLSGSYAISVTSANTAGTVTTGAQPNITSVGTLTGLTVNGNASITRAKINAGLVQSVTTTNTTSGNLTISTDSTTTVLCNNPATGNYNLNINTSIGTNESVSVRFIIQQNGNVAYGVDSINYYVNGVNQAPRMRQGGSALSFVGYTVYDIQVINAGSGLYPSFLLRTQVS